MTDAQNFAKLVPGFDFLQGLAKNAGTALPGMGQWVAPIGGALLMSTAGYVFGRRRPERDPVAFALATFVAYAVIDIASGLAMTPTSELFTPLFGLSLAITGAGGLAGGWLARSRNKT